MGWTSARGATCLYVSRICSITRSPTISRWTTVRVLSALAWFASSWPRSSTSAGKSFRTMRSAASWSKWSDSSRPVSENFSYGFSAVHLIGFFLSFTVRPGQNTIRRRSTDSNVTIPYERTFRSLANKPAPETQAEANFNWCGCGWPNHMLIPRWVGKIFVGFCSTLI